MAVLAALERLELQHNQLTELPPGMDKLKKLRWVLSGEGRRR